MCALETAGPNVRYKLLTILQELNNERNLMYVIVLVPVIQESSDNCKLTDAKTSNEENFTPSLKLTAEQEKEARV